MKNVLITTLLKLLSATVWSQHSLEVNLINGLNEFFAFDHNIFLLTSLNDHNRDILVMGKSDGYIPPQTVYIYDQNVNATNGTIISTNTFLIVVAAECFKFQNDTHILDEVISIRQLIPDVKIGIFFESNLTSMDHVLQLFQWSWSNRIVNIFCAFYLNVEDAVSSFTVFRFDPFEGNFLLDLTGSESFQNYFPDKIPNYHEHPLRLFGLHEIQINSFELSFWRNIVSMLNASMSLTYISQADYEGKGFSFSSANADIGVFESYLLYHINMYPLRSSHYMLLVPHSRPYSNVIVYLQNTTWKVLFAYTFAVIAIATLLLTVSVYLQTNKTTLLQRVADVINLIINDNTAIKYRQLYRADVFIVVPLTFTGLIVANGILSVFKSYLAVPIYERQINTIDDLFESRVPILTYSELWANITIRFLENESRHTGWSERVHQTSYVQWRKNLFEFNNSVAYSTLSRNVQWLLTVQKRLNLKAYHLITEKFIALYFVAFRMNPDFPFIEPINTIFHRLTSSGIIEKWERDLHEDRMRQIAMKSIIGNQFNSSFESDSNFDITTIVWCGWIAGVIVFISELIWNKIQSQIRKLKQTWMHRNSWHRYYRHWVRK